MNTNPYRSATPLAAGQNSARKRWLLWTGLGILLMSAVCLLITVLGMVWTFESVAASTTSPTPSELSRNVSYLLIPSFAAVPLGLLGLVFLIVGMAVRKSDADQ